MKYIADDTQVIPSERGDEGEYQMAESVAGKLRAKAAGGRLMAPPTHLLVEQVPDAVQWLRSEMTGTRRSEGRTGGQYGPRDPFRVAMMAAADREFSTLAYWAGHYSIAPAFPVWRVNGVVRGVGRGGDMRAVYELSEALSRQLQRSSEADGMSNDPVWGMWTIRKHHYSQYPGLAGIFDTGVVMAPEPEQQELF